MGASGAWGRLRACLALAVLAAVVGVPGDAPRTAVAAGEPRWLTRLNAYRAQYGVRPLRDNPSLARGIEEHSRYIVKTDDYGHDQNPSSGWSTSAGRYAGARSNIAVSTGAPGNPDYDVDSWMRGPFHALAMLDPRLQSSSYASFYEPGSPGYRYGSGLDVLTDRDGSAAAAYPLTWPRNGSTIGASLTSVADETPDPLAPCRYSGAAGLPVMVTFGPRVRLTGVSSYWLRGPNGRLEACATWAGSYSDRSARGSLAALNTVLVIPRQPLVPGGDYTVSVSAAGITETFSFSVARVPSTARALATASRVTCGESVDIAGSLANGYGGSGGQQLVLWQFAAGSGRAIASRTTDANGAAGFAGVRPPSNSYYLVRYAGNAANEPSRSALVRVLVTPVPWQLQADASEYFAVQGRVTRVTGKIQPGRRALLAIERKDTAGRWKRIGGTTSAAPDGTFAVDVPSHDAGRYELRVAAMASGCNTLGHTAPFGLTVLLDA